MILGYGWLDFGVIGVAGMLASIALATVWGPAEAEMDKKAGVERGVFGKLDDGTAIEVFTLRNSKGAAAKIITYGGTLSELWVPDRAGKNGDVVLGFDDLKGYLSDHPHFGGVIGRYANRIAKGKFSIDGQEYTLATNNGPNTLHGGTVGFDRRVWKGEPISGAKGAGVRLTYVSPDGEEHFPGTLTATVVYTLSEDNALKIEYTATTDKPTAVNLTNHSYFNLSGGGDVLGYTVTLNASRYTPVDSTLIPTGELAAVKSTAYDFTKPMSIGSRIAELAKVKEMADTTSTTSWMEKAENCGWRRRWWIRLPGARWKCGRRSRGCRCTPRTGWTEAFTGSMAWRTESTARCAWRRSIIRIR